MALLAGVEQLASEQRGLVTRAQLLKLGVRPGDLRAAVRRGELIRRDRGVYAVSGLPAEDVAARVSALRGVASHETAALWWDLELPHPPTSVT